MNEPITGENVHSVMNEGEYPVRSLRLRRIKFSVHTGVEQIFYVCNLGIRDCRKVCALWDEVTDKAVGVFISIKP